MPASEAAPSRICREAAQTVSSLTELLDVMWERSRVSTAPASTSQLRLMYVVDRQDGIRMRTVCHLLASSPPNVSRMCDRLQAIGFLERLPSPESGREITLRLSPAGKKHLQGIREQREAMLCQVIDHMPASELRALARGLTGLAAQLTAAADDEEGRRPGAHLAAPFLRRSLESSVPWRLPRRCRHAESGCSARWQPCSTRAGILPGDRRYAGRACPADRPGRLEAGPRPWSVR